MEKKVESVETISTAKASTDVKMETTENVEKFPKAKQTYVTNDNNKYTAAPRAKYNKYRNDANSAPRDFQSIKESIEAKINAFFDTNQSAGLRKLTTATKLMEAGTHIGLQAKFQNPKMKLFVYQKKGGKNQVIDILKTLVFLNRAYNFLFDITKSGGRALLVGTHGTIIKDHIKEEAKRTKSYYINQRWLGGTLTNFKTVSNSINKLNKLISLQLTDEISKYSKKEQVDIGKEIEKLTKFVGGIRTMRGLPQVIIVTDPITEHNAVAEARKLKIPVIAITNTNADPDNIDFIIPANTNSIKSVYLIISVLCDAIAEASGAELKVVGKKDEEIILPEVIKAPRKVVFHKYARNNDHWSNKRSETSKPTVTSSVSIEKTKSE